MKKIVIIGCNSYVANGIEQFFENLYSIHLLHHYNWKEHLDSIENADFVINFSMSPSFSSKIMNMADVIDVQIAEFMKKRSQGKFIFISSRKVYGISNSCITHYENDLLKADDIYAENKIAVEKKLQEILKDNLLVLRISNVIGDPVNRANYRTFVGWICESFIQNGNIIVNQNIQAKKDFVTVNYIHECIYRLVNLNSSGIYNLSSGIPISIETILKGYVGSAYIHHPLKPLPLADQFVLSNSKLNNHIDLSLSENTILECLEKYKKKLFLLKAKSTKY